MANRTDEFGRAYCGSQRQIQTYVNQRRAELDTVIQKTFTDLECAVIQWVSPLAEERFAEYRDGAFLHALGLTELAGLLTGFWPVGGPRWDALARVYWAGEPSRRPGALLVEAKSHPGELYSSGCRATAGAFATIRESLGAARLWLGATADAPDWQGPLYQFANRLAHLYWLRRCGVEAWFAHLCFLNDPHSPTSAKEWSDVLLEAHRCLGLCGSVPFSAEILLDAGEAKRGTA